MYEKTKKLTCLLVVTMLAGMLTACLFPAQKEWVKQMEKNYTDDTFTFTGKTHRKYETRKIWGIILKSEKCGDSEIDVYKEDDGLYSNYMTQRYYDEIDEYTKKHYTDAFKCDRYEFLPTNRHTFYPEDPDSYYPIKNYKLDDFLDQTLKLECSIALFYEGDLPSDEEVSQMLLDQARKDRRICHLMLIVCHEGATSVEDEGIHYSLVMDSPDHIKCIEYNYLAEDGSLAHETLVRDLDLD